MKINLMSDLHLSVAGLEPPRTDADLIVLAGDIARPDAAIAWARSLERPVLYVPGNHEFYGGSLDGTVRRLKQLAQGTAITVLDNEVAVVDGVRFLGSTLWTNFELAQDPAERLEAERIALSLVWDFSRIRIAEAGTDLFSPRESAARFATNAAWIAATLAAPFDGPTVVITHHAPSRRSIHPRFADSPINDCFVSEAEALMDAGRVDLWIHGHTHNSFDYRVGATRVLCNPRGYRKDGVNENPDFELGMVIPVPDPARAGSGARV